MNRTIGQRLKDLRENLQLSQADFASQLAISARQYAAYERDECLPGAGALIALFERGFSVDWILTGAGAARRNEPAPGPQTLVERFETAEDRELKEFIGHLVLKYRASR